MNRNITRVSKALQSLNSAKQIEKFFNEILTEKELQTLSKRWQILIMLNNGHSQRDIAKQLNVSLCKITRGAKILKNEKSICKNFLKEEKDYL